VNINFAATEFGNKVQSCGIITVELWSYYYYYYYYWKATCQSQRTGGFLRVIVIAIVDWEYKALYDVVRRTDRNQARGSSGQSVLHYLCDDADESGTFRHLAPEIQRDGRLAEPTRAADVFSFGVVVRDLFVDISRHDRLHPGGGAAASTSMPFKARQLMALACDKAAVKRPTFDQLEKSLRRLGKKTNLLDRCV